MADESSDLTPPGTTRLDDLVVIGCSAGGIEALSHVVATLPAYFPAPIVVAQHPSPAYPSHLQEILAHHSALPVRTVTDEAGPEILQPGVVYVAPTGRDVEFVDQSVRLRTPKGRVPRPSIDRLLISAAHANPEHLIAVILTGTGADGSAGARAVKAAGGLVIVENPATASYSGMPSALAPAMVDIVADLKHIGPLLCALLTGAYTPADLEMERARHRQRRHLPPRTGATRIGATISPLQPNVARLRQQLARMGAANRELIAANITLHQTNERLMLHEAEAQAASEEIRTLSEEMLVTNEELEALNEELEATVEELRTTNDDLEARSNELHALSERLEQQRQASERARAQLEAIVSSMSDALLVVDTNGQQVVTNAAYTALLGGGPTGVVLQDVEGNPLSWEATPLGRGAQAAPFQMAFTLTTPDGARRWLEAHGEPIRSEREPAGTVVAIRDISDRSLRLLEERFVHLVIHELRAPLTPLLFALETLKRLRFHSSETSESSDADSVQDLVNTALRQVDQMKMLVEDLTDLTRTQRGELKVRLQALDLHVLLRQIVNGFARASSVDTTSPQIVLDTSSVDRPMLIGGDAARIEQMVINLLTNALKYAPHSPCIDLRLRRAGDMAELAVQDYGPGIPAVDLPHLFSRYYRIAKPEGLLKPGLGLGLYITYQLMQAHNGVIEVHSEEGKGTTFTLRFPLLTEAQEPEAREPEAREPEARDS